MFHKLLKGSRYVYQSLNLYRPRWVRLDVFTSDNSHWQGPGAIEPFLPTTCPLPTEIPLPAGWQNTAALSALLDLIACMDVMRIFSTSSYFLWLPKVSIIPPVASAGRWPLVTLLSSTVSACSTVSPSQRATCAVVKLISQTRGTVFVSITLMPTIPVPQEPPPLTIISLDRLGEPDTQTSIYC